jgi:hypothetical protein
MRSLSLGQKNLYPTTRKVLVREALISIVGLNWCINFSAAKGAGGVTGDTSLVEQGQPQFHTISVGNYNNVSS